MDEEKQDLADVFTKNDSGASWLSSLPRAPSPPLRAASPQVLAKSPPLARPPPTTSPSHNKVFSLEEKIRTLESANASLQADVQRFEDLLSVSKNTEILLKKETARADLLDKRFQQLQTDAEISLQNERQTISLLVSEKASLLSDLQQLDDAQSKAQEAESSLEHERAKLESLQNRFQRLQEDADAATHRAEQSQLNEKELSERVREQERQLQLVTASASEYRKEMEQSQRKLRELEEQIQSDDRVERLENSLKHTQDRADELEFQLSKLKQTHSSLKLERDKLESQGHTYSSTERELEAKIAALNDSYSNVQSELNTTSADNQTLTRDNTKLRGVVEDNVKTIAELREKLVQASSEITTSSRQAQAVQNELRSATRRAEDAEKTQRNLQLEGTNLMRALDEMRPKIVELTGAKLELAEKVEDLERTIHNRDITISQLESLLNEVRSQKEESEHKWQAALTESEKEHSGAQNATLDLQKAHSYLEEELETALASLRNLELQRTNHHQEVARLLEEFEKLKGSFNTRSDELYNLKREVEARRRAQEEEQEFLERAQNEIEGLRAELDARDEEIQRLHEAVSSPSTDAPQSLDDELIGSLRQQHALDLSAAQSQIRALENIIFDGEAKAHALQKQINALQDQVSQLQSARVVQRSFSPIPSRPASDLGRSSFGSHRPSNPPPLSRSVFDQNLSPETRHKRKVSLSMLKARIDSEVAATSRPPSRALSPVHSEPRSNPALPPSHHTIHRPQFLDESHVFWCHSCQGDLVIL